MFRRRDPPLFPSTWNVTVVGTVGVYSTNATSGLTPLCVSLDTTIGRKFNVPPAISVIDATTTGSPAAISGTCGATTGSPAAAARQTRPSSGSSAQERVVLSRGDGELR